MSARRWDAEGVGERVSAAIAVIEESRRREGKTIKVSEWKVGVDPLTADVCVELWMSDGVVEVIHDQAEAVALQ